MQATDSSVLTRRTRSDGVVNRTVTIDPQNAERVSFSMQHAADLDANRKGRKPNLRFRMGTRTDNRGGSRELSGMRRGVRVIVVSLLLMAALCRLKYTVPS